MSEGKCWKCDRKRSDVSLRMCDDRLCQDCDDTNRDASEGRARDDHDAETNSAAPDVNQRNDAERSRIVVNELLSFVPYKLNMMAPDTIVQLCSSFYDGLTMPRRYCVIYALVATTANIAYIQTIEPLRKMSLNMKDIVSLFTRKHDSITVSFVVADLGK